MAINIYKMSKQNPNSINQKQIWSLLHSMAAYYPISPSDEDRSNITNFLNNFVGIYGTIQNKQMHEFSTIFMNLMQGQVNQLSDQQLDSKENLSVWMCKQHNYVKLSTLLQSQGNKVDLLSKSTQEAKELYAQHQDKMFDCSHENLKKRWG